MMKQQQQQQQQQLAYSLRQHVVLGVNLNESPKVPMVVVPTLSSAA
jgi:hypothetical protein